MSLVPGRNSEQETEEEEELVRFGPVLALPHTALAGLFPPLHLFL